MAQDKKETRKVTMRVSGGSLPKDYSIILNAEIDFTGATREELIEWALSDRRIACQRWLRSKNPEFLEQLQKSGFQVHAREAGRAQKTREDRIKELENAGVPREVAEVVVDDPQKLQNMINSQ